MSYPTGLPPFVLRVGVTGARHIAPDRLSPLRAQVDEVLGLVVAQAERLAANHRAKSVYAHETDGRVPITLRMISPLAEGADRLVAQAALDLGYDLVSPLPFSQAEYEKDFPSTIDAFRDLLAKAQVVELDGGRGGAETLSYEAVGRFVVRNCDLLIALWDGKPAKGQGGTADIVRFSVRSAVPVWWIDPATGETCFIAGALQWHQRDLAPRGLEARAKLVDDLLNLVLPPVVAHPKRQGLLGFAAHHYCRVADQNPHPLDVFLAEPAPKPTPPFWQAFNKVYQLLAAPRPLRASPPSQTPRDHEHDWQTLYQRADALSVAYGDRYRSSYVIVILVAFLAFAVSVIGAPFHHGRIEIVAELAMFAGIGSIIFVNHVRRWHERWMSYRLIAELCRNQMMLMPLWRTLAGIDVSRLAAHPSSDRGATVLPREAWVGWYYLAALRAAPCHPLSIREAKQMAFDSARSLVAEQEAYHRRRSERADMADHRLALYSDWFGGGLVFILALVWVRTTFKTTVSIDTIVTLLSGASAAFVGLRGYAEFALLAQQSLRMETIMRDTAAELDDLDLDAPLSSQELGAILQRLAGAMMQDVSGWAQLFRQKMPETL